MGIPEAPPIIKFPPKGGKAQKTYIWMPNAKGNLVKMEASTAKKSFATLPIQQKTLLAQYLLNTNRLVTDIGLKSLWGQIVDGAVAEYKGGNQSTPWDVLKTAADNNPITTGITNTQVVQYDPVTANALLNNIALGLKYDVSQLSDADRLDFASKLKDAAGISGKVTSVMKTSGGTETTVTPNLFDAKTFTENWIWAKINFGDTKSLPPKAISALSDVKGILRGMGIDHLSNVEVTNLARELGAGHVTKESIQAQYLPEAIKNYPLLADRLTKNPGSTVMDLASQPIALIAKWLEIDPETIDLTNPYLDKYLRPDGIAGKVPMQSSADLVTTLKNSADSDKTMWKNDAARSAATATARAMGFGV